MAAARSIPIARTMSSPADPGAPSLITTIPPELRNNIYDLLFKYNSHVLLHDVKEYRARIVYLATEVYTDDEDDEFQQKVELRKELEETGVEHLAEDEDFHHDLNISLLLSCRLIYHEATSILYGSNTFLFSRVLNQEDSHWYDQFMYAPKWLSNIGSQIRLLRRVSIDFDAVCPVICAHSDAHRNINWLPLLRIIWANLDAEWKISFAHTGRLVDNEHSVVYDEHERTPTFVLNNILDALGRRDVLNIKRYAKFERLMPVVVIRNRSGSVDGYASHPSTGQPADLDTSYRFANYDCVFPDNQMFLFFHADDGGHIVRARLEEKHLLQLPDDVLRSIYRYTCFSKTGVTFDLTSHVARGLEMALLGVSRRHRYEAEYDTSWSNPWMNNKFTVSMTTETAKTDFGEFVLLHEWLKIENFKRMVFARRPNPDHLPRIVLEFNLDTRKTFLDIRINIKSLLHPIHELDNRSTILISLKHVIDNATHRQDTRITLGKLRRDIFILLSEMIAFGWTLDDSLPELWFNGEGTLLCANCPATVTTPASNLKYHHAGLDTTNIISRGYREIENITAEFPEVRNMRASNGNAMTGTFPACSVMGTWIALRDVGWEDWWYQKRICE
ncbi:hypothetical protein P153DRAFT_354055 [Dothidotthia symphoricarpi CBS 119687]|uniref:DUF7730 domain-containing protein n=1 Tax=Dothidotthia symphoricarpi CBS 119687 TaxID=1392245 RepID=A0A6A6APV8_9PLEO|nr:uncharacterized protein P153DRAFT_354055 [Dothidotthia symphoricarpi CBS 119687]KAF2132551.1 hypothetical protein P153DRAFT_354055 [Dothidotthia symphoricarpi CBS 119687]